MEFNQHTASVRKRKGECIFQEGELPDGSMYFILKGKVGFYKKRNDAEILISESQSQEFFGEMALVCKQPRSMTVRVLSDEARLVRMDKTIFTEICKKNSSFMWRLIKLLAKRLQNAESKIARLHEILVEQGQLEKALELQLLPVSFASINILDFVNNVPTRTLLRGEKVVEEGEQSDGSLYFLFKGELSILKQDGNVLEEIRVLYPGDFFGELSLISSQAFMATVEVKSSIARIARLDRDVFVRIARQSPLFLYLILERMVALLTQREDLIDRLTDLSNGKEPKQYGVEETEGEEEQEQTTDGHPQK